MTKILNAPFRPTYEWDKWTDGKWRQLTRPEDFDSTPSQFRNAAYVWARRHNHRVQTRIINPTTVQLYLEPLPAPPPADPVEVDIRFANGARMLGTLVATFSGKGETDGLLHVRPRDEDGVVNVYERHIMTLRKLES